jgi:4-amino-4-deoxy-L-arabinose transferase-like glycosyltransferase
LIAAGLNAVGGLALARTFSLLCMLVTIVALYGTAGLLFGRRAAGWAVAIFVTVSGTAFLAAFATYDAMALMLLSLGLWVSVRYAQSERAVPHAGLFLGVPILALANATKYATGLYDLVVIAVVAVVVAARYGRREGIRVFVMYIAMLGALLCALVALAGSAYQHGIVTTTLSRASGYSTVHEVLHQAVQWIGAASVLSLAAVVVAGSMWLRRHRDRGRDRRGDFAATMRVCLIAILAFAIVLAPIQQARIHTTISLHKHTTFGAWFAAIAVGGLLSQMSGRRLVAAWRWAPIVAVLVVLGVIGQAQAVNSFAGWPNVSTLVTGLQPYLAASPNKPVLIDDADVAKYYVGGEPTHWVSPYFLAYQPPHSSELLTGEPAFLSAVDNNHFGVVALNFGVMGWLDDAVVNEMAKNPNYHYVGKVPLHSSYGPVNYQVWVNRASEAAK